MNSFELGFIKRAMEYGLSEKEANGWFKNVIAKRKPKETKLSSKGLPPQTAREQRDIILATLSKDNMYNQSKMIDDLISSGKLRFED